MHDNRRETDRIVRQKLQTSNKEGVSKMGKIKEIGIVMWNILADVLIALGMAREVTEDVD